MLLAPIYDGEIARNVTAGLPHSIGAGVADHLADLALQGKILTRANVIKEIERLGYALSRIGKDYLTVLDPKTGERSRLRGTLFVETFNGPSWVRLEIEAAQRERNPVRLPDRVKTAAAAAALEQAIARTAAYNQRRYSDTVKAKKDLLQTSNQTHARDHQVEADSTKLVQQEHEEAVWAERIADYRRRAAKAAKIGRIDGCQGGGDDAGGVCDGIKCALHRAKRPSGVLLRRAKHS